GQGADRTAPGADRTVPGGGPTVPQGRPAARPPSGGVPGSDPSGGGASGRGPGGDASGYVSAYASGAAANFGATSATAPPPARPGVGAPRIVLDQVHVTTLGTEATVEVRLHCGGVPAVGKATGPAVDAYLLRLAAQAAAASIDALMTAVRPGPGGERPSGERI